MSSGIGHGKAAPEAGQRDLAGPGQQAVKAPAPQDAARTSRRGTGPLTRRGAMLALLPVLAGCSALQSRPYVEPLRFPLQPLRPAGAVTSVAAGRRPVLLLRLGRAAPGLEGRMLRSIRPDGTEHQEYYAEWSAPPAEAVEDALRRWLTASGLFAAVVSPGSRAGADLVLEVELTALHADLRSNEAVAAISAVLLREGALDSRVVGQFSIGGKAPLPGNGADLPVAQAPAEVAALAAVFTELEERLALQSNRH